MIYDNGFSFSFISLIKLILKIFIDYMDPFQFLLIKKKGSYKTAKNCFNRILHPSK